MAGPRVAGIVGVGFRHQRRAPAERAVCVYFIEAVLDHLIAEACADIAAGHLVITDVDARRQAAGVAQVLIKARLLKEVAELALDGMDARDAVGIGAVQRLDYGVLELFVAQIDAVGDGIDECGGLALLHTAG